MFWSYLTLYRKSVPFSIPEELSVYTIYFTLSTGNEKYLSFVNVCYRLRNSIAHCNASILRNSLAFRTVIAALDEQDFTGILKFLLGSSYNQIDVKLLYSNLSNFQIKWNPPLNSSKEIFLDYHKKTRELENKLKTI